MASRNGRIQRWARSLAASTMPSGKPMSTQNTSDVSTSDSVTMASGQMPSSATRASAATLPSASARPANCQASNPNRAIMASAGMPVSRPSTPVRVLSMGPRTVWKNGRKCSTTQPRPWLIQDSMGRLPSSTVCSSDAPSPVWAPALVLARSVPPVWAGALSQSLALAASLAGTPSVAVALSAGAVMLAQGSASAGAACTSAVALAAGASHGVTAPLESLALAHGSVSAGAGRVVSGVGVAVFMRGSWPWLQRAGREKRAAPPGCRGRETSAAWSC